MAHTLQLLLLVMNVAKGCAIAGTQSLIQHTCSAEAVTHNSKQVLLRSLHGISSAILSRNASAAVNDEAEVSSELLT